MTRTRTPLPRRESLQTDRLSSDEEVVYRSDAAAAAHESMEGLYDIGLVPEQEMRAMDARCLVTLEPMSAEEVKALRESEGATQAVLARHLNVSKSAVEQWESGAKRPSGAALKLLWLARKNGLASLV